MSIYELLKNTPDLVDLHDHVVVPTPDPLPPLRARNFQPIEIPSGHLTGPITPVPASRTCPLCSSSDEQHSAIWHAYGPTRDVKSAVRASLEVGLVGATTEIVKKHMSMHHYVQPAPDKRLSSQEMLFKAESLQDREKEIIVCVYRHRALTTKQLTALFWREHTSSDLSAQKSSYRTLRKLAFLHMLYQFRPKKIRGADIYYFLGRHGAPFVESEEGRLVGQGWVTDAAKVSEYLLSHDTGASDIFIQLRNQTLTNRDPNNLHEVAGSLAALTMPIHSWWSARSLACAYTDPFTQQEMATIPDGFAVIGYENRQRQQGLLPFFYEWDTGTKDSEETVSQILDYIGFAVSGAIAARFPQLASKDWVPPVLVVTKTVQRARKLQAQLREAAKGRAPELLPYVLLCDTKTLQNGAFQDGAMLVAFTHHEGNVDPNATNLLDHLMIANKPLLDGNHLNPSQPIQIDLEGARVSKQISSTAINPKTALI